ncbi:fatty acyl-CoA reductase wat-like [Diabrotica virgifera virgifera]|uniref:Fatty acyl-CoA reductase n=2 Tax=Diabrotica virgifera virgifera TaxID=50390 RepID=A0A6P7EZ29_DIAVI|nr:fatty acyl-CoA reductase wat-like [Diabrotica virgifera virgifera]
MYSDVRSFYKNKNILLTGGTGFLGKLIIEKLLRTCDVEGIYLIVKPKKGLSPEERLRNLLEEPVLAKVRHANARNFHKIHVLDGNLTKKQLGLSEENRTLIKNKINIVFHCGATLNMDLKLQEAVITNVRGTMELLELIKESEQIQAFVQVSTAFSNCYEKTIEEKFYETPIKPELLIQMSEEMNPEMFNSISGKLVGKWPNTYVYTKAITENIVLSKGKYLPVGVFRPAIVTSTVWEPFPGWSDNLYGPLGILLSSHCGLLRVIRANGNLRNHTVPGDMCINAILCFAWDVSRKWDISKENVPPVLNFSAKNTKLFLASGQYTNCSGLDYLPFKKAMWHQFLILAENRYYYLMLKFILHTIPAYIIDTILVLSARKARMKSVYAKIEKTSDILSYFLLHEWDIHNDNVSILWSKMSQEEKEIFNFNVNSVDFNNYMKNMMLGLKKYILKEDMAKAKLHRQRYQRLTLLHYTLKYTLFGLATIPIYKTLARLCLRKRK